jgi:hypothetical protein
MVKGNCDIDMALIKEYLIKESARSVKDSSINAAGKNLQKNILKKKDLSRCWQLDVILRVEDGHIFNNEKTQCSVPMHALP